MAGAGRRVFQPAEVLTATNVQTYLQDQTVMVFAGTAARGSAIGAGTASEGMTSYLTDNNAFEFYSGTAVGWEPIIPVSPNMVINGGMDIVQRGTASSTASGNYAADRFYIEYSTGTMTTQRVVDGPDGVTPYSFKVTATGAGTRLATDYFQIVHNLEGQQVAPLGLGSAGATNLTLSFYVKSSVTGSYSGALGSGANTRGYGFSYTVNAANTWERKVISILGDTTGGTAQYPIDNTTGLRLRFALGNGTNYNYATADAWVAETNKTSIAGAVGWAQTAGATFQITGIKIERGAQVTPFTRAGLNLQGELAACQRYYYLHASGDADIIGTGSYYSASDVRICIEFPVTMRATPTIENVSGTDYYSIFRNSASDGFNSLAIDFGKTQNILVFNNGQVSGTAGQAGFVRTSNAAAYLAFKAEL